MHDVASFLAHAFAWKSVSRFVYSLPTGWAIGGFVLALVVIVVLRRRRGRSQR